MCGLADGAYALVRAYVSVQVYELVDEGYGLATVKGNPRLPLTVMRSGFHLNEAVLQHEPPRQPTVCR